MNSLVKITAVATVTATTLLGAGCATHEAQSAARPSTTAKPAPVETHAVQRAMYPTVADLRDAVEETGLVYCDDYTLIADPINAIARATCTDEVSLSVHADEQEARDAAQAAGELVVGLLGGESVYLIGANWGVSCADDRETCVDLSEELGGSLYVVTEE